MLGTACSAFVAFAVNVPWRWESAPANPSVLMPGYWGSAAGTVAPHQQSVATKALYLCIAPCRAVGDEASVKFNGFENDAILIHLESPIGYRRCSLVRCGQQASSQDGVDSSPWLVTPKTTSCRACELVKPCRCKGNVGFAHATAKHLRSLSALDSLLVAHEQVCTKRIISKVLRGNKNGFELRGQIKHLGFFFM